MEDINNATGVTTNYYKDASTPTGTCAVLVVDKERSLVANLAAANNYKIDHLNEEGNWALVEQAKVVYSAGFFITVCADAMLKVAEHCTARNKLYCLNLAAPFIVEVPPFKKTVMDLMPHVDYLFGNETEALAFAKSEGWTETDVAEIACKMSMMPSKKEVHRTVVITQGADPTVVAHFGKADLYPVLKLEKSQLVDTNGAGDAYVGGFLAKLVQNCSMDVCCKAGAESACVIVQRSGCTFPDK